MSQETRQKKTAGAFDIRNVIGSLLTVYGVVLLIVFAFAGNDARGDKDDNLWAGLVMLVVGLIFLAWARLRPIVVAGPGAGKTTSSSVTGGSPKV
jgi:hypothetical protein